MGDTYSLGVVAAFLINVGRVGVSLADRYSVKSRNMKRINLHYDFATGGYKSSPPGKLKCALAYGEMLLLSPLFSWLSAGFNAFQIVRAYVKKGQVPERIKEITFKLASVDLPKEKVKECMNDLAQFYGLPAMDFRSLSDDEDYDSNELVLSSNEDEDAWVTELYLSKESKTYTMTHRSPDHTSSHTTVFDYAFNGPNVKSRVIEHKFSYYGNDEYDIRNGVVLEDKVRTQVEDAAKYSFSRKTVEDKLAELQAETEWSEPVARISYFVLFRHGEVMSDAELKRYFSAEIERIQKGCRMLENEVTRLGWQVVPPDFDEHARYLRIRRRPETAETNHEAVQRIQDDPSIFNVSYAEFCESDVIIKELKYYIARLD